MKLKSISFENYKAFKEKQTLEIRPITLLIGKNSSGKSAVAKLFTLLENSLSGKIKEPLLFNNDGVELGGEFRDLVYAREPNTPIKFSMKYENNKELFVSIIQPKDEFSPLIYEWRYGNNEKHFEYYQYKGENIMDELGNANSSAYIKDFEGVLPDNPEIIYKEDLSIIVDYIGPFRVLPQRQFHLSGKWNYNKTGVKGENAYEMLANNKLREDKILEIIGKWYEEHFDGWKLIVKDRNPYFEILLSKNVNGNELEVNIVDVGQGMNQALPLVVRAYAAQEDSIVVLEQPELHLHPAAHADLAELFAWSAKENDQSFIIETHSENMLLRLRKLVVENDFGFTKDDIIIYWIAAAEHSGQQLNPITIDEEGDLSDFPEGVFNENLKEILEIDKALNRKNKA